MTKIDFNIIPYHRDFKTGELTWVHPDMIVPASWKLIQKFIMNDKQAYCYRFDNLSRINDALELGCEVHIWDVSYDVDFDLWDYNGVIIKDV